MTVLVTRNPDLFNLIDVTPDLEDGIGPVAMGVPLVEGGENPRYAVCHPFAEIDCAWIVAYCTGETPEMLILGEMPEDWKYPNTAP